MFFKTAAIVLATVCIIVSSHAEERLPSSLAVMLRVLLQGNRKCYADNRFDNAPCFNTEFLYDEHLGIYDVSRISAEVSQFINISLYPNASTATQTTDKFEEKICCPSDGYFCKMVCNHDLYYSVDNSYDPTLTLFKEFPSNVVYLLDRSPESFNTSLANSLRAMSPEDLVQLKIDKDPMIYAYFFQLFKGAKDITKAINTYRHSQFIK